MEPNGMELAVIDNSLFNIAGVKVTPVSLTLPENLEAEKWFQIGKQVMQLKNTSNWVLGDWWVYGENKEGSRKRGNSQSYESQLKLMGKTIGLSSLRKYGTTCRRFPAFNRLNSIDFTTYYLLTPLNETQRNEYLEKVKSGEIKTNAQLRKAIHHLKDGKGKKGRPPKPIILENFEGIGPNRGSQTCHIDKPLPTWHKVAQPGHRGPGIVCTHCWSIVSIGFDMGSIAKIKLKADTSVLNCECPDSTRTGKVTEPGK